ncbi:MAG: transpeptidase family protein [Flammeovirgaceae bacterium]|nr:transpeptidase family protein [Flammeovirgaceae bacterium]
MGIRKSILVRVRLAFLSVVLLAAIILVKIFDIQIVEDEKWQKAATEYGLKFMKVNASRGNIVSDDGSLLATSLPFFRVALDPSIPTDELFNSTVDTLSFLLAEYFENKTAEEYSTELKEARESGKRYKLLSKQHVKYHHKKMMEEWPLFREGKWYGGVIFEKVDKRFLPFGSLGRRTIGHIRLDSANEVKGVGLEKSFNSKLAGISGEALYQKIPGGDWKPVNNDWEVKTENGLDIETTLNIGFQEHTTEILERALKRHNAKYGSAIVMEVETGEIKAMVNLSKNGRSYIEDYNYAIGPQGTTEPGSTFKLASFMALLEETNISIDDIVNAHDGKFEFYEDCVMKDAVYYGYGKIPIRTVFEKSSNIGTSRLVFLHFNDKPNKYLNYLDKFGLTSNMKFQMVGEGVPFVNKPGEQAWSGCSLPWLSIGYEVKLSPLQLLSFYNAVANNGKLISPIIVRKVFNGNKIIEEYKSEVLNEKICSDKTIQIVQELLEGVVKRGTAKDIKTSEYKIAGKTGTTHKLKNGRYVDSYYTSFVGYFPADNPKYSILVAIDDPKNGAHYGGEVAAPVFREIADLLFIQGVEQTLPDTLIADGVFPLIRAGKYDDLELLTKEFSLKSVSYNTTSWVKSGTSGDTIQWHSNPVDQGNVPNVVGMTLKDALYLLENQGLKVKSRGIGRVQRQSLKPGGKTRKGGVIYISLG